MEIHHYRREKIIIDLQLRLYAPRIYSTKGIYSL
jgi:hypothetical protein